jgi:hypothetical protein
MTLELPKDFWINRDAALKKAVEAYYPKLNYDHGQCFFKSTGLPMTMGHRWEVWKFVHGFNDGYMAAVRDLFTASASPSDHSAEPAGTSPDQAP